LDYDPTEAQNDKNCLRIKNYESFNCNTSGYYCEVYPIFKYTIHSVYRSMTIPNETVKGTCHNVTTGTYCEPGYYCPSVYEKEKCPRGNFCGHGFDEPKDCTWGKITCPDFKSESISQPTALVMFGLALAILLYGFKLLILNLIKSKEAKYNKISNHDELFDAQASEMDQKKIAEMNFKKLIDALHVQDDATDAELIETFKIVDTTEAGVVKAKELEEVLKSKHMSIDQGILAEMIRIADVNGDGEVSEEEFIGMCKSMRGKEPASAQPQSATAEQKAPSNCSFQNIQDPLEVSFENLNLYLSNGSPVLQGISGCVSAYNVTALMGWVI